VRKKKKRDSRCPECGEQRMYGFLEDQGSGLTGGMYCRRCARFTRVKGAPVHVGKVQYPYGYRPDSESPPVTL
jgi:late competence protein required for DNA uptake (superfamily II DNA/RNA helicase)